MRSKVFVLLLFIFFISAFAICICGVLIVANAEKSPQVSFEPEEYMLNVCRCDTDDVVEKIRARIVHYNDMECLNDEDRDAFYGEAKALKEISDRTVGFFFWVDLFDYEVPQECYVALHFSTGDTCAGCEEVTCNGVHVEVTENYMAKLRCGGAVAVFLSD